MFFKSCVNILLLLIDRAVDVGAPPLLCGKVSRDIKQEVDKLTGNSHGKKLRRFSECFSVSENFMLKVQIFNESEMLTKSSCSQKYVRL